MLNEFGEIAMRGNVAGMAAGRMRAGGVRRPARRPLETAGEGRA